MASKPTSFSKWRLLEAAGTTEDLLLTILANSTKASEISYKLTAGPTRGILYNFASVTASTLQRRPNRALKLLVETMFPQCKVSRADRLERRIKSFERQLDSISSEEQDDYLQKEWTPQATGILVQCHVYTANITVFDWSVVQWNRQWLSSACLIQLIKVHVTKGLQFR